MQEWLIPINRGGLRKATKLIVVIMATITYGWGHRGLNIWKRTYERIHMGLGLGAYNTYEHKSESTHVTAHIWEHKREHTYESAEESTHSRGVFLKPYVWNHRGEQTYESQRKAHKGEHTYNRTKEKWHIRDYMWKHTYERAKIWERLKKRTQEHIYEVPRAGIRIDASREKRNPQEEEPFYMVIYRKNNKFQNLEKSHYEKIVTNSHTSIDPR